MLLFGCGISGWNKTNYIQIKTKEENCILEWAHPYSLNISPHFRVFQAREFLLKLEREGKKEGLENAKVFLSSNLK
jgi:hypothetical protein